MRYNMKFVFSLAQDFADEFEIIKAKCYPKTILDGAILKILMDDKEKYFDLNYEAVFIVRFSKLEDVTTEVIKKDKKYVYIINHSIGEEEKLVDVVSDYVRYISDFLNHLNKAGLCFDKYAFNLFFVKLHQIKFDIKNKEFENDFLHQIDSIKNEVLNVYNVLSSNFNDIDIYEFENYYQTISFYVSIYDILTIEWCLISIVEIFENIGENSFEHKIELEKKYTSLIDYYKCYANSNMLEYFVSKYIELCDELGKVDEIYFAYKVTSLRKLSEVYTEISAIEFEDKIEELTKKRLMICEKYAEKYDWLTKDEYVKALDDMFFICCQPFYEHKELAEQYLEKKLDLIQEKIVNNQVSSKDINEFFDAAIYYNSKLNYSKAYECTIKAKELLEVIMDEEILCLLETKKL